MGLDIIAYRGLRKGEGSEGRATGGAADWENGWVELHRNDEFPGRADEIESGAVYLPEEKFYFRAGSYGGYNIWREHLALLAGFSAAATVWDNPAPGPFMELIDFSDCEGTIGATVARKLAQDFAAFQAQADRHPSCDFRELYADWRRAFEMAADRGAVLFS